MVGSLLGQWQTKKDGEYLEYTWEKQYWVSLYVAACLVHLCNGGHHRNAIIVLAKKRLPLVDMLDG